MLSAAVVLFLSNDFLFDKNDHVHDNKIVITVHKYLANANKYNNDCLNSSTDFIRHILDS